MTKSFYRRKPTNHTKMRIDRLMANNRFEKKMTVKKGFESLFAENYITEFLSAFFQRKPSTLKNCENEKFCCCVTNSVVNPKSIEIVDDLAI